MGRSHRYSGAIALVAACAIGVPSAHAQSSALTWMTGCWRMERGATVVDEHWGDLVGGLMLGTSRTVRGGRAVEHEFSRITVSGDTAQFHAMPSGQEPAIFRGRVTADSVVFDNPDHDFPTRVGYRTVAPDTLHAWVSGGTRRLDFHYVRVSCEPRSRAGGS